jgi:cob(I)alamin adenosyltransferase
MKIYTKTGDKGNTSLLSGARVPKNHLRIEAYGNIDELNSYIGLLRDHKENKSREELLLEIQDRLFTIGSILAADGSKKYPLPELKEEDIEVLEKAMDQMDLELPPMRNFVLPGGHPLVSYTHIARTVCRRAERGLIALSQRDEIEPLLIGYLNRLSDYLFVLSRKLTLELQVEEKPWLPKYPAQ